MQDSNSIKKIELSFFEINGRPKFAKLIKKNKRKTIIALNHFLVGIKNEASDTKEASKIIVKYVATQHISKEEEKQLKSQVADFFKIVGIGVPFVLIPGASLLIPFIVKIAEKKGIDLMPSSFNSKNEKK